MLGCRSTVYSDCESLMQIAKLADTLLATCGSQRTANKRPNKSDRTWRLPREPRLATDAPQFAPRKNDVHNA